MQTRTHTHTLSHTLETPPTHPTRPHTPPPLLSCRYRALGIALADEATALEVKKQKAKTNHDLKWEGKRQMRVAMWGNKIRDLPQFVPY